MLTSKEIILKTNISRATLNNYIKDGILRKPLVGTPVPGESRARQIGYFPVDSVEKINTVKRLKKEGYAMSEIVKKMQSAIEPSVFRSESREQTVVNINRDGVAPYRNEFELKLTIDRISYPAYLVNYNFELLWYNSEAQAHLLGNFDALPPNTEARNVFRYLLAGRLCENDRNWTELIRFHLSIVKSRLSHEHFMQLCYQVPTEKLKFLENLYSTTVETPPRPIVEAPQEIFKVQNEDRVYHIYAVSYREGILFLYVPGERESDSLLDLLARRDVVIRDLLSKRLPVLTPLAVLVADLQDSVKICSELPPEEYFELINEMWAAMEPIFRKYYGTHAKHVGDGMVYYFFPQPDCSYIFNALQCAQEIKRAAAVISKKWQLRKQWLNELYLNIGVNEGEEWLGMFRSATSVEFTVLGDTINHVARLSDFARCGSIWATKNLMSRLTASEKERVRYGIRRAGSEQREIFVEASYARLSNLVDLDNPRYEKIKDIVALPITEIIEVKTDDRASA